MDYTALRTAIADWSARSDLTAVIPDFIAFATDMFNHGQADMAPLRVREMLSVTSLTPTSGTVTLPSDYLQYERVVEVSSQRRELKFINMNFSDQQYPLRQAGTPYTFTIVGNSLTAFPTTSNNLELTYWQRIPDLSASVTSNWLLAKVPAIYLHAGLMQVALYTKDDALFQRSAAMVRDIVNGLMAQDMLANYSKAGTNMRMMTP